MEQSQLPFDGDQSDWEKPQPSGSWRLDERTRIAGLEGLKAARRALDATRRHRDAA
ncbi:MAG: hypothetical protein ACYCV1_05330 [Acidimicrobiales bacterium]